MKKMLTGTECQVSCHVSGTSMLLKPLSFLFYNLSLLYEALNLTPYRHVKPKWKQALKGLKKLTAVL